MKANKTLIAHMEEKSGKVIVMKDVHNHGLKKVARANGVDESELTQINKALET